MYGKHLPMVLLAAVMTGAFAAFAPAGAGPAAKLPADFRDAPNSAYSSLQNQGSEGAPSVSAPAPAPAPSVSASVNVSRNASAGTGDWSGWRKARADYGYLPGTQNVESGTQGFGVYYRCSRFYQGNDGKFFMNMQFGNDKGGDLGIVTWTKGPSNKDMLLVKFEGTASLFAQSGAPYTSKGPVQVLNGIKDYNGMCDAAYKTVDVHRPAIAKFLMRKDIKSLQRMYKVLKFVPGPMGEFAETMEMALDVGTGHAGFAGIGAGCLGAGMIIEKASHGVIKQEWIRYMLAKECTAAATAGTTAYEHKLEEGEKEEVYFAGHYKDTRAANHSYVAQQPNGQWVTRNGPMIVALNLAYLEDEGTVKNIFFDNWR